MSSQSRTFNVSQFVRDNWLAGVDEWHTLDRIKRRIPEVSNELLGLAAKQYRELEGLNTFSQSERGIGH